jgi:hypothetical protein
MPGKSDIPASVKPGEPIRAAWMNPLLAMARAHGQLSGSFASSIFNLTRPMNVGGGGVDTPADLALLYGEIQPANITYNGAATDASAGGIAPGSRSEDIGTRNVLPLTWNKDALVYEAVVWPDGSEEGTPGTPMKLPGENHCWETYIVGGTGSGGGEPPLLVEGHTFTTIVEEMVEEELTEVTVTKFAVTRVVAPQTMFVATADAAVAGEATFAATGILGIHNKLPTGSKTIQNTLAFYTDVGGKVIIVRGLDAEGVKYWAVNATCPEEPEP